MSKQPTGFWLYAVALAGLTGLLLVHELVPTPQFTPFLLVTVVLLAVLMGAGEHIIFRIGRLDHSLAASIHIATIILLPPPFPLLIALVTVVTLQARSGLATYKKLFNSAHTALTVGVMSAAYAALALAAPSASPLAIPAHLPAIATLIVGYVLIGNTLVHVGLFLLSPPPRRFRLQEMFHDGVLFECVSLPLGVLGAALYQVHPVLLVLLITPMIALYVSFEATARHADALSAYAETLGQRNVQLRTVVTTSQALRVQQSAADTLWRVAEGARALSGAAAAAAYLRDPDAPARLERVVLEPDDAPHTGPAWLPLPPTGHGIGVETCDGGGATVFVPVESLGDNEEMSVVGALRLIGMNRSLTDDDRDVLLLLATQAATALENTWRHERALAQASEDSLTGLLNHRALQTRVEEELARARRGGYPLALMMVDLDGFGAVNNAHGHQAGDVTLVAVARALRAQTRYADVAARYGGDEFALILPETDLDEALALAERIRGEVARLTVAHGTHALHVTASIGVAVMPNHANAREDLIGAADSASYAAKRAGGDGVRQAERGALPRDPVALAARLDDANLATVEALAAMVDAKDAYTRGHSGRVAAYAAAIAAALGLPPEDVARIHQAGILHDVGKIGVPDAILLKPDKLTEAEFEIIKEHPVIGERVLRGLPFLQEILPAVRHHHERWDGGGYPDGLAGAAIPPDAAILAVADSFDAMTSSRTYRPALLATEAIRRIREGAGAQYDTRIVAAFDRAVADGTLSFPPMRTGDLWVLPPRAEGSLRTEGVRTGALRIVG